MKALTLTQPWAQLIADGRKKIETRSWQPVLRGQIAIHAAKGWTAADRDCAEAFGYEPATLTRGAIVAVARISHCFPTLYAHPSQEEAEFGNYTPGRYAWFLSDVRALPTPMPCKGALGLWDIPTEIEALL